MLSHARTEMHRDGGPGPGEEALERRLELERALRRAVARVTRRIQAVQGDLARAEVADELGRTARLFVAEASRAPRGARELVAVDWSTGEAVEVRMPLDPARSARDQVDAAFQRAKRLKDGGRIARARLAEAESARAALERVAAALAVDPPSSRPDGDVAVDLAALESAAKAAAPRDFQRPSAGGGPRKRGAQEALPPYRTFTSTTGGRVLVGKGAEKNDELTFHVARPHHLWLHAKGYAGAHVVVPLDRGASCPAEALVEAAHLAAHFSEARAEAVVEVQYVRRGHVRKPRGSPPGLVVVDREKVLVLRKNDDTLRRLLEREVL